MDPVQGLPVSVIHIVVRCEGFKGTPGSSVHLNATRMLASMKTAKERWVKTSSLIRNLARGCARVSGGRL